MVVFRHPSEDSDLIKRVIGLPGDTIAIRGGRLSLNGRIVPRIDSVIDFTKLPPAKERMEAGAHVGKIVLRFRGRPAGA